MAASSARQPSRLYGFVRGRQLDGTYPGDRATGIWGTTGMRIARGWGSVSEDDWPYSAGLEQWPPVEPPGLDEKAKRNRIQYYQRIHDALECKWAIMNWGPVQASFEVTEQWFNAKDGIIEMPNEKTPFIGSHCVSFTGYSDEEEMFNFANSWGEEWGQGGFGKLPYDYFDKWMLDIYTRAPRRFAFPPIAPGPIAEISWVGNDFAERPFHVLDIYDPATDERMARAFALPGESLLFVEELFVRPQYRRRGYGTRLLRGFHNLARKANLPLRILVPFADCGADNLKAAEQLFAKEGYFLTASDFRWAPYMAMRKPEFVRIPPPPALVRRRDDKTLAAAVLPVEQASGGESQLSNAGVMSSPTESRFIRLMPVSNSLGDTCDQPWIIVLSDWSSQPPLDLPRHIAEIVRHRGRSLQSPTIIVVDDLRKSDVVHEMLLSELTEAGAIVLAPNSQEETEIVEKAPLAFAAMQMSHSVVVTPSSASDPNLPNAYKEFGKAITRLKPDELKEIIEGPRTDDWRYSI